MAYEKPLGAQMKIIISHDVDHLYWSDHLKDLIYPKLWVRETLAFFRQAISPKEYILRINSSFSAKRNHIEEIVELDNQFGVSSTFFFGMANGLGMSYSKSKAKPNIEYVLKSGLSVGVHGIEIENIHDIKREFSDFLEISGLNSFGIRTHYVRYDSNTFHKFADVGYLFDASEFDKKQGYLIKAPYKVGGRLWEFPLTIMEGYLPYRFEEAKERTVRIFEEAIQANIDYVTILFHDYLFFEGYIDRQKWYRWLLSYCVQNRYEFINYNQAIAELEKSDD